MYGTPLPLHRQSAQKYNGSKARVNPSVSHAGCANRAICGFQPAIPPSRLGLATAQLFTRLDNSVPSCVPHTGQFGTHERFFLMNRDFSEPPPVVVKPEG